MTLEQLHAFQLACVDKGKLIEAGWIGLRIAAVDKGAPEIQLDEMRMSFFAGAQHLFGSIMSILEPGDDPTTKDLARMELIATELEEFLNDFKLRKLPMKGQA